MECALIDLGLTDYKSAFSFQQQCLDEVKAHSAEAFLVLTEHKPVYTLGRFAKDENLLIDIDTAKSKDIDVVRTNRGGDITFHGPGQLVAYPILDLTKFHKDVHRYLHELEDLAINLFADFDIQAFKVKARTGAWTEEGKMASIGIGVSRWVTYHGIAINANVDLEYFRMINPCGFTDIKVTSMHNMLGRDVDMETLKERFISHFCRLFCVSINKDSQYLPKDCENCCDPNMIM